MYVKEKEKRDNDLENVSVGGNLTTAGPPCNCVYNCYNIVGKDHIKIIFDNYNELGSHSLQTAYISGCIKESNRGGRKRSRLFCYTVKINDKEIKVCRKAFVNMHGVTFKRIRNVIEKITSSGGTIPNQRGMLNFLAKKLELVERHINKVINFHFYLKRSVAMLYVDYKDWIIQEDENGEENIVKLWKYRKVFNEIKQKKILNLCRSSITSKTNEEEEDENPPSSSSPIHTIKEEEKQTDKEKEKENNNKEEEETYPLSSSPIHTETNYEEKEKENKNRKRKKKEEDNKRLLDKRQKVILEGQTVAVLVVLVITQTDKNVIIKLQSPTTD